MLPVTQSTQLPFPQLITVAWSSGTVQSQSINVYLAVPPEQLWVVCTAQGKAHLLL